MVGVRLLGELVREAGCSQKRAEQVRVVMEVGFGYGKGDIGPRTQQRCEVKVLLG